MHLMRLANRSRWKRWRRRSSHPIKCERQAEKKVVRLRSFACYGATAFVWLANRSSTPSLASVSEGGGEGGPPSPLRGFGATAYRSLADMAQPKLARSASEGWRRGRDSNPRNRSRFSGFQDLATNLPLLTNFL